MEVTLEAVVVERPEPTPYTVPHRSLEKGYDNPTSRAAVEKFPYNAPIRRIGEEKSDLHGKRRYPARRWMVERTLAWLSRCRAILVRYDKKASNYLALLKLACALDRK